jgi:hypothetical protein
MTRRLALVGLLAAATAAAAQRPGFREQQRRPPPYSSQVEYDGRVTFARLAWRGGGEFGGFRGGNSSAWNHDYPRAEQHLAQILRELTFLDMRTDGSKILTLDDPELFKYPISFMWEPGFWALSDSEAASFRDYLLKGGFAVFEDFDGRAQWANFEQQMHRVLPGSRFVKLEGTHRIFDSFFTIHDLSSIVHPMNGMRPSYYGIFEDNDPSRRLMVVANFDNDVPEYWEWSGEGLFPFDQSNEAYKLGINYMIYAMTH